MKSKKRHHDSSEESEESDASLKSSSTSESDSDDSSISEARHKKKKKRADSSDSDSNSDQKRTKKRKHKKKKKKHSKKKRRPDSLDDISDDNISISEGEISSKKKRKHKHKHSKRAPSSVSEDERYENHGERRLHSVVKERRASSEAESQPSRTYYQKEYHEPASTDNYQRQQEPQKYYRDSNKPPQDYRDRDYNYDRERSDRYPTFDDKYNRQRDKYGQTSNFTSNQEYSGRPREYNDFKRPTRYEEQRREEQYKREREPHYEPREELRGNNKFNRYEDKSIKPRIYNDGRDYRDRRAPPDRPEPVRYHVKEYEKRDRYNEDRSSPERSRDARDKPGRLEKPPVPSHYKDRSRSRSEEDRSFKEKRRDDREERGRDRYKDERDDRDRVRYKEERDERRERPRHSAERDRRPADTRRPDKSEAVKPRERKSRFDNGDDSKEYSWGKTDIKKEGDKSQGEKEKPNFGLSGKLTADANTVNGVVIKYTEPDDAKQPKRRWRFYPFKGDKALPILYIHRQSSFIIGRDKKVVDIALEHPSISKQHSALQYRATPFTRPDGSQGRRVRPYIIDLDSANGTFVNNKKIDPRRYIELLERDVVKFGFSQREYVLLHENSKDDAQDDDQEPCGVTTTEQIKIEKRAKEATVADGE